MVLSFPDGLKLVQTRFDISWSTQNTPLRGGGGLSIGYAPERWACSFETPNALPRRLVGPIRAFVDKMRGGLNRVYVWDWLRPYPYAYPSGVGSLTRAGGGAFDGTADITSISASTLALATLPASFVITADDMVGLVAGDYRSLHRVVESVTANGSGVATVTVEPPIATTVFTASATANFVKPVCIMQADKIDETSRTLDRERVSFSLVQVPF